LDNGASWDSRKTGLYSNSQVETNCVGTYIGMYCSLKNDLNINLLLTYMHVSYKDLNYVLTVHKAKLQKSHIDLFK
jgi:hypothetical protein